MKETTINKAYALHEEIIHDSRYLHLLELEKEMENNEEVCLLSYRKDTANSHYNDMLKIYNEESDEVKKARHDLFLAKQALESHPVVIEYLKAYQEVRELFDNINDILFGGLNANLCPKNEK